MKPSETTQVLRVIAEIWPSMKISEYTPDAWHTVLGDLDASDAIAAVRYLARVHSGYITPADIRRQVAGAAGLLALSEAEAFQAAGYVAGSQGAGAGRLDEVTYRAYRAMGGPTAFDAPASVLRPQFGRVYAEVKAQYENELLGGDLGAAVAQARRAIGSREETP